MFASNGRIYREHEELFTETSWLAVMVGQGIEAKGYHPAADLLPDSETLNRLAHIREVIETTAKLMPTQDEFLGQVGGRSEAALRCAS
jgi:tryptophan halogenase